MKIRMILDEDYQDYKKPSMLIAASYCNWKCCTEQNLSKDICQNSELVKGKIFEITNKQLFNRYKSNSLTTSIVIGGLEPFLQFKEVYDLISYIRYNSCDDDIVIYTGYDYKEIKEKVEVLKKYKNIIIKFGRYKINSKKTYDDILGIELASDNQYAVKIS